MDVLHLLAVVFAAALDGVNGNVLSHWKRRASVNLLLLTHTRMPRLQWPEGFFTSCNINLFVGVPCIFKFVVCAFNKVLALLALVSNKTVYIAILLIKEHFNNIFKSATLCSEMHDYNSRLFEHYLGYAQLEL